MTATRFHTAIRLFMAAVALGATALALAAAAPAGAAGLRNCVEITGPHAARAFSSSATGRPGATGGLDRRQ